MLPDQRVGWCSCTCRESSKRPMRATIIFLLCAFWHIGKNLLCKMLCLARSLFCCPKQSLLCLARNLFCCPCATKSGLSWFASLHVHWSICSCSCQCNQWSTYTHTHTHIDETHNAPHTAHTNSHDICNCTACINNRHRQAHIDHDIQSTFHILPHIHNMCTQLITPCERYNLQCCVSKHITTICVQPHHCCMHVAQAQLCSFVLVCQLLQVNLSTFITCCVADVYWQYCVCWCIVMCGCACNARPCTLSSRTCFVVCVCMVSSVCLAFHICVLCNVLWVVSSSRSAEVLLQGQGQLKSWGCKL